MRVSIWYFVYTFYALDFLVQHANALLEQVTIEFVWVFFSGFVFIYIETWVAICVKTKKKTNQQQQEKKW